MSSGALDPLIHDPDQLRIVAILAALPAGDALSVLRLQDMIGLTPGSLIALMRELGSAGPDGAAGPGQLFPREAGKTRAQARLSSSARSMAAPSRLDPRSARGHVA